MLTKFAGGGGNVALKKKSVNRILRYLFKTFCCVGFFEFHPEKPSYEWISSHPIPRTNDVIYANFYLSSFFVQESRKSTNRMSDATFKNISIYNYEPTYLGGYYEQQYIFPLLDEEIKYNEQYYELIAENNLQE